MNTEQKDWDEMRRWILEYDDFKEKLRTDPKTQEKYEKFQKQLQEFGSFVQEMESQDDS